jgi:hypothetical protein
MSMAEKSPSDPLELLQISRELLAAQQRFLPSAHIYARMAEAMRSIAQANASYLQELTRANAALLAAFLERPGSTPEETPSEAAHKAEPAAR